MSNLYVQVKDRTRGNVTTPMVLWSVAMAVVLFLHEARWGVGSDVVWAGVVATVLFGAYLGWRRRVAAVFVAPLISWLFAWLPLLVASMIRDGFVRGLFVGFFWISIGWAYIGLLEFAGLFLSSAAVRAFRPGGHANGPDVVIFGPDVTHK